MNRPFAACHSRGTKPPCWNAKVALEQDQQKAYIIWNSNFLCFSCPSATFASQHGSFLPREWQATKFLLYQTTSCSLCYLYSNITLPRYYTKKQFYRQAVQYADKAVGVDKTIIVFSAPYRAHGKKTNTIIRWECKKTFLRFHRRIWRY